MRPPRCHVGPSVRRRFAFAKQSAALFTAARRRLAALRRRAGRQPGAKGTRYVNTFTSLYMYARYVCNLHKPKDASMHTQCCVASHRQAGGQATRPPASAPVRERNGMACVLEIVEAGGQIHFVFIKKKGKEDVGKTPMLSETQSQRCSKRGQLERSGGVSMVRGRRDR